MSAMSLFSKHVFKVSLIAIIALSFSSLGWASPVTVVNTPLPVKGKVTIIGDPAVQTALPSRPFFDEITLVGSEKKAVGTNTGTLGVTTITISNFDSSIQQLFLFNPSISSGSTCNAGTIAGGSIPVAHLILEPNKTVQLQYPIPLVFTPIGGLSCIAAEVTTTHSGAVTVGVNGFIK